MTPGIYLPLPDVGRLVLGARLMTELQAESSAPGLLVMPVAQLDWKL